MLAKNKKGQFFTKNSTPLRKKNVDQTERISPKM